MLKKQCLTIDSDIIGRGYPLGIVKQQQQQFICHNKNTDASTQAQIMTTYEKHLPF